MSRDTRNTVLVVLASLATVALFAALLLGAYLTLTRQANTFDYVALAQAIHGEGLPSTPSAIETPIEELPLDELTALTARNNAIADYYDSVARLEAPTSLESPPVAVGNDYSLTCRNGTADLNIRNQPRRTAPRLGQIPPNALLQADWNDLQFDTAGNPWLSVRYEGSDGVIEGYAQYLNQSEVYLIAAAVTNCAQDFEAQFG